MHIQMLVAKFTQEAEHFARVMPREKHDLYVREYIQMKLAEHFWGEERRAREI